jgi:hypothetical protein
MTNAINNKILCLGTRKEIPFRIDLSANSDYDKIIGDHAYYIKNVSPTGITLYNPHDGGTISHSYIKIRLDSF